MSRLRKRQAALEATRASRAASDLSPVALIGSDSHGEITLWNRAATALLGWNAVDVVGRQLLDVLGCDAVPVPKAGTGANRVSAQVSSQDGGRLEVELIVDGEAHSYLTSGVHMIAAIPAVSRATSVQAGASPRVVSWVEAAGVIRDIGGIVHCVAIGLVGVDAVNRGYSRSTGDAVLREIAGRLETTVGRNGRVMRVAGNHFVAITPTTDELDVAQLVELVSQPVDTRLGNIRIGCYAGSIFGDSASGLVVLGRADAAMTRARGRGIGAVETLSEAHASTGLRHPRLVSLLIDAVARGEIEVAFQPVVEMETGRITEFEALARWTSSEIGEVDPGVFIEAAEEAGLIHELGRIVLEKSLDVVQAEVLAGRWGGRRLSVNFSSVQMSHPDLETRVVEALSSRCLPGEVLQLELTHTRLLPDTDSTMARLSELRDFGVRLAMDDFGTGYTNMAYLRDLPVEAIKIDAQFVAGICTSRFDMAVIRSILSLARELHVDVIVEGVETAAQHFALKRLGCVAAQGFLYSGDRAPADLYRPIELPDRPKDDAFPFPHDPEIASNGDRLEPVLK